MSAFTDAVENAAGRILGEAEVAVGGRLYPVTVYEAEVDPGKLWRGSVRDAAGLAQLKAQGFEAVVNLCRENDETEAVCAADMYPWWIRITDNTTPSERDVSDFLEPFMVGMLPVYVHCEAGKGRTGCMVAAYRVLRQGWTPERALAEAEAFGLALPAQRDWILGLKP